MSKQCPLYAASEQIASAVDGDIGEYQCQEEGCQLYHEGACAFEKFHNIEQHLEKFADLLDNISLALWEMQRRR